MTQLILLSPAVSPRVQVMDRCGRTRPLERQVVSRLLRRVPRYTANCRLLPRCPLHTLTPCTKMPRYPTMKAPCPDRIEKTIQVRWGISCGLKINMRNRRWYRVSRLDDGSRDMDAAGVDLGIIRFEIGRRPGGWLLAATARRFEWMLSCKGLRLDSSWILTIPCSVNFDVTENENEGLSFGYC